MPDIPTTHGYMATLNLLGEARKYHKDLLISAKDNNKLQEKITAFFNTQIYNPERYQQILALFLKKELNTEEAQAKQAVISEYKELHTEQHLSFEWNFITTIRIENSFLAVNTDQNPLVDAIIKDIQRTDCSPYGAVQKHFTKPFRQKSFLNEYLTPQRLGFNIGNDLTWQMGIEQQHLLTVSTNPSSPTVTNNPRHALSKELREYYPHYRPANQKQKRYHFYQASSPRYSDLKGDALKSHVLLKFKNKLEACANLKNLQTEIANIKKSNDYEILIKGQGIVTRLFHLRTSAAIAFEEMSHELTAQHQHTEIHEKGTSP